MQSGPAPSLLFPTNTCNMSNCDCFGIHWSPSNDTFIMSNGYCSWIEEDWIPYLEPDMLNLQGPENATIEAQPGAEGRALSPDDPHHSSSLTSSQNKKRDWESVSSDLPKAKGKGVKNARRRRSRVTISTGQPSTSQQQPEPKSQEGRLKELIMRKSVPAMAKVYMDRMNRRMKNDKMAGMEAIIWVVWYMMANNVSHLLPQVFGSLKLKLGMMQWPIRPDLQDIKQKIHGIESNYNVDGSEDEAKRRFVELGDEFERLNQQREKDMKMTGKLDAIFTSNMDFNMETRRKELSSACSWLISKKLLELISVFC
ncbi:hypothetical protein V6N13_013961 [Hibiscus sabdariffa]